MSAQSVQSLVAAERVDQADQDGRPSGVALPAVDFLIIRSVGCSTVVRGNVGLYRPVITSTKLRGHNYDITKRESAPGSRLVFDALSHWREPGDDEDGQHGSRQESHPLLDDRRLTGLAGPDYDTSLSFGLPIEPEDSQYGESSIDVMQASMTETDWNVLLLGGHSAAGKTTAAELVGRSLGVQWMKMDDLRLAFQRARVSLPKDTEALYFDTVPSFRRLNPEEQRDGLIAVGEALSPALEVIIENHVDQSLPVVIEGNGIVPSLLSRPPVVERSEYVRAVFLIEPDETEVLGNMLARSRAIADRIEEQLRNEARAKWQHGQWLSREAASHGLPIVQPRPWETLVERIIRRAA